MTSASTARRVRRLLLAVALLPLAACAPDRLVLRQSQAVADARRPSDVSCPQPEHCAVPSALLDLGERALAASTPQAPRHATVLLESGQEALLARIHLIRAARHSIDLQSFIYAEDDAGYLVLNELLEAARRGVRVRVLLDQLFSFDSVQLLAGLAQAHANFDLRLYNPTFHEGRTSRLKFVAGILFRFSRFNQRMHNKLLLVDGHTGITGGRNYQNRYFDWDPDYNYRDREVVIGGPVGAEMQRSFEEFWNDRRAVPVAALRDVARRILDPEPEPMPAPQLVAPERLAAFSAQADDPAVLQAMLLDRVREVGSARYISDAPDKPDGNDRQRRRDLSRMLRRLVTDAQSEVLLQTPYLVFSRPAGRVFRDLHRRPDPPQVTVSTNSLAATDAFPVYALSHKYNRRYLRDYGFHIYEYKPFPEDAPIAVETTGALPPGRPALGADARESRRAFGSGARGGAMAGSASGTIPGPVPLQHAGVRIGLHAKSMVVDDRLGMIGTHNFDPRSDHLNTESALLVWDAGFARELRAQIERDMAPANSWVIAPRRTVPVLSTINYGVGRTLEALPVFDLWPWRYATSWALKPGCAPLAPDHPRFAECYEPVGDFPEVELPLKTIYTRVLTAFGAGLAPIL